MEWREVLGRRYLEIVCPRCCVTRRAVYYAGVRGSRLRFTQGSCLLTRQIRTCSYITRRPLSALSSALALLCMR